VRASGCAQRDELQLLSPGVVSFLAIAGRQPGLMPFGDPVEVCGYRTGVARSLRARERDP
jgi:hypothetical protein